ncbi:GNAT family N-acetyltransferase [Agrobacterium rosae]|uniref:GNAT family N-acetyltransferase n=2 Tax=Agrobacterium rosae TaxID=1972867 RepID=A0AAE5RSH8_9HYPH|nr:GNAT family N-acetyltransferase [Agrobacterium rosae]KAA3507484.1 GNAT family N-acetyltransferase [Agrobacterium rosae]KAA3511990.1 GNAT family N-acetyltransferase [Agrobacterium rosae]MBN7804523.1 GNAT family N-acetyltransferase [Agrobacterium rosae]MCM2435557.1 GNAT family N-acetyltransferase [Agrobacterium rosae]MDX8332342.1 GNAT family N-acetyltransferase [Agrobacterium rosae]
MRVATKSDVEFIVAAYASAFAFSRDRTTEYIEQTGLSNFHVIEHAGSRAAVLALIETGHWFSGKIVPACNIAHVAISPEYRGLGIAGTILDFAASEAIRRGAMVASLFASTRPLYRKSGFELAGSEIVYEADTRELYKIKGQIQCRRVEMAQAREIIKPIYAQHCRTEAGVLDRNEAHWNVLLQSSGDELATYVFEDNGHDIGYIVLDTGNPEGLVLRDWAALSGITARQILKFLGTFSTVYPRVRWHGAPQDALTFEMPDKGWRLVHQEEFLMRILSPKLALAARGYECSSGRLRIDVVEPSQKHSLLLTVDSGIGTCEEDALGSADITIELAQFATLYSGFRNAQFLAKAGWISGEPAAIKQCCNIFSGPTPWVGEHF